MNIRIGVTSFNHCATQDHACLVGVCYKLQGKVVHWLCTYDDCSFLVI